MQGLIRIISVVEGRSEVLQVQGWLRGEAVEDLMEIVGSAAAGLVLDLSELRTVDSRGIEFLRSLVRRGVVLERVPQYVALRI
jgi:anti-anti-sigma regulatory factor